jgi:hypothetical protein
MTTEQQMMRIGKQIMQVGVVYGIGQIHLYPAEVWRGYMNLFT